MKIFVINLKKNMDRMEFVSNRLNKMNLNFERFDAIDGSSLPIDLKEKFKQARPRKNGRIWLDGHIGCFFKSLYTVATHCPIR
jgi:glycosyl transferase family 25